MKKMVLVGLLSMVLATSGLFAQEVWGGAKNFVSGEVSLLGGGARYERILTPHWSVGADGYWSSLFFIWNEIEAGAFARYYIWKGLFAELGLGFHIHSGVEEKEFEYLRYSYSLGGYRTYTETGSAVVVNTGFSITPAIGWKFDPGKDGGFFLEPVVRVPVTLGQKDWGSISGDLGKEFGASVGVVISLGLGWAF